MSSKNKNLSDYNKATVASAKAMRVGIVVAEWNKEITEALYLGALNTLKKHGAKEKNITRINVPGSFELTLGAQMLARKKNIDAVICIGCVIQGETKHFDFICSAVAAGITQLNIIYQKPIVFGVLTPNNYKQAEERAGGKHGNKGVEAAITAIKMTTVNSL
jgi:6,7-dimethyl-8-ribityllumazine synthase